MITQFSAPEQSLGYHYQIRYALYLLLKSYAEKDSAYIQLENLDDITVGDIDQLDLFQTKFHAQKTVNLSNSSVDLWKTIRVWSQSIIDNLIDLDRVVLFLVTTCEVSNDSILLELTQRSIGQKSNKEIAEKLTEISKKSRNSTLQESFTAYNLLSDLQKEQMISSIQIVDSSLSFDDIEKEVKKYLQLAILPQYINGAYQNLEGYWYGECIKHLLGQKDAIRFNDLQKVIWDIREELSNDNLPIDEIIRSADIERNGFDKRIFVNQLIIAGVGVNTISRAILDFYRSSEQRSKWLREELLNPEEEIMYDKKLIDDWQIKFSILLDDTENMEDDICLEKSKHFYVNFYGNTYPQIFIRPKVTEPFVVRGSCHMLADKKKIAWHPKFNLLLTK
ncbi:hypothetical protein EXU85_06935 [Spirosoma sp. KCTC 42546]|uniref:ABC-three component system protein n=1 Tax=Spirosoma sp. KCTC 42546 TaxID=2520506 RepID=UPI001158280C|nr:ABC-three component system protein [Spirosoma sp. KCTC 42546]QDK78349.1 hypothetical protein EXU85_06935 [Spirosoma sp. KCTC 42546]